MTDRIIEMGTGNVRRLVFKMSIPAIMGMLATALYTMVDRLFLSTMIDKAAGNNFALSAITVINPFTLVALALLLLLSTGAATLISIYLGEGDLERAEKVLGNCLLILTVGAVIFGGISIIFEKPLLYLLGASENTYAMARDYFSIICMGLVFLSISFGMSTNIRAEGNAHTSMVVMVLGTVLNVILDPIFIGVFNMGIKGAAIATILSEAIATGYVFWFYLSGKSLLKLRLKYFVPDYNLIYKLIWIGLPQFLLQMVSSVIGILYNKTLRIQGDILGAKIGISIMGDNCIAAYGIITMVTQIFLMCVYGINNGIQPLFGFNYGAKKYDRVKEVFKWALIFATGILTMGFIVCLGFPHWLVTIFEGAKEVGKLSEEALRIQVIVWPIIGASILATSYFQAVGKPMTSTILSMTRQLIFLFPSIIILSSIWGVEGVWYSAPIADLLATVLSCIFLRNELKKLKSFKKGELV